MHLGTPNAGSISERHEREVEAVSDLNRVMRRDGVVTLEELPPKTAETVLATSWQPPHQECPTHDMETDPPRGAADPTEVKARRARLTASFMIMPTNGFRHHCPLGTFENVRGCHVSHVGATRA